MADVKLFCRFTSDTVDISVFFIMRVSGSSDSHTYDPDDNVPSGNGAYGD